MLFRSDKLKKEEYLNIYNIAFNKILEFKKKYDYILMDCHALYYDGSQFIDFKSNEYYMLGDIFFYLNTQPSIILDRMKQTNGIKCFYNFTENQIKYYQCKEIERLNKILFNSSKKINFLNDNSSLDTFKDILKVIDDYKEDLE